MFIYCLLNLKSLYFSTWLQLTHITTKQHIYLLFMKPKDTLYVSTWSKYPNSILFIFIYKTGKVNTHNILLILKTLCMSQHGQNTQNSILFIFIY